MLWRAVLTTLAAVCLFVAISGPVVFPSESVSTENRAVEQERRIGVLEAVSAEHRLTALETSLEGLRWEVRSVLAGVAGLVAEAVFRLTAKRRVL